MFAQQQSLKAFELRFDTDIEQLKCPIIEEFAFNFLSAADYPSYRRQDMIKVQNDWQLLSKNIDRASFVANLLLAMDRVFRASILDLNNAVSLQEMRSKKISSARKRASGLTLTMAKFLDRCLIADLTNFQIIQLLEDGKVFVAENTLRKWIAKRLKARSIKRSGNKKAIAWQAIGLERENEVKISAEYQALL